jgi:hypothetical protein
MNYLPLILTPLTVVFGFWRLQDGSSNKMPLSNLIGWLFCPTVASLWLAYLFYNGGYDLTGNLQDLYLFLATMGVSVGSSYLVISGYDGWQHPDGYFRKVVPSCLGFFALSYFNPLVAGMGLLLILTYMVGSPLIRAKWSNRQAEYLEGILAALLTILALTAW